MIKLQKRRGIRFLATVLALLPFASLVCLPQSADAKRQVLVKVYGLYKRDAGLALTLQTLMRLHLPKVQGVSPAASAKVTPTTILSDAIASVERGLSLVVAKQYVKADAELTKALNGLQGELGNVTPRVLARAFLGQGVAKGMSGDRAVGLEAIKTALVIDPWVVHDLSLTLEPKAKKLVDRANQQVRSLEKGTLSVTSTPSGAEVYVQGRLLGVTPLNNASLEAGKQYVMLKRDGYKPQGMLVLISGGTSRNVSLIESGDLTEYRSNARKLVKLLRRVSPRAKALMAGLSSSHGTQEVIVVAAKKSGRGFSLQGLYYNNGTLKRAGFQLNLARRHSQIKRFLSKTLGAPIVEPRATHPPAPQVVVTTPVVNPTPTPPSDPTLINPDNPLIQVPGDKKKKPSVLKKWWFWTIIGLAVGGGVAAIVVLSRQKSSGSSKTGNFVIKFN